MELTIKLDDRIAAMVANYSEHMRCAPETVIKNLVIDHFARTQAKFDTWPAYSELMPMFAADEVGVVTDSVLYDDLLASYTRGEVMDRTTALELAASQDGILDEEEEDFLRRHKKATEADRVAARQRMAADGIETYFEQED